MLISFRTQSFARKKYRSSNLTDNFGSPPHLTPLLSFFNWENFFFFIEIGNGALTPLSRWDPLKLAKDPIMIIMILSLLKLVSIFHAKVCMCERERRERAREGGREREREREWEREREREEIIIEFIKTWRVFIYDVTQILRLY